MPGVGSNTAGALLAFAFNEPVVFVETNIRAVFIHYFFQGQTKVTDKAIMELLDRIMPTVQKSGPAAVPPYREFYWALMDYGAHLKQTIGNVSQASQMYAKQATFAGSRRQLRGRALRLLLNGPVQAERLLEQLTDPRSPSVLASLEAEGLIRKTGDAYDLP